MLLGHDRGGREAVPGHTPVIPDGLAEVDMGTEVRVEGLVVPLEKGKQLLVKVNGLQDLVPSAVALLQDLLDLLPQRYVILGVLNYRVAWLALQLGLQGRGAVLEK